MVNFKEVVPRFPESQYKVDISLNYLKRYIAHFKEEYDTDFDPDFQRDYVWTEIQKINYIEFLLKGGESGKEILFNHPNWTGTFEGVLTLLDGKQRLSACLGFLNNEIPAFGYFLKEFEDPYFLNRICLSFRMFKLQTKAEIIQWYIAFNSGGTIHSQEDLNKALACL